MYEWNLVVMVLLHFQTVPHETFLFKTTQFLNDQVADNVCGIVCVCVLTHLNTEMCVL